MGETQIEWTHRVHPKTGAMWPGFTFNPWIGCTHKSPACKFCYADALDAKRFSKIPAMGGTLANPVRHFGAGAPRHRTVSTWKDPLKWNRLAASGAGMALAVFCASLSDWADEEVSDAWRDDLFTDVILPTPNLDWLLLTKRTEKARDYLTKRGCPPNVWLGATMENQEWFDRRIVDLLSTPGPAVYFASMEPLLGPVDISTGLVFGPDEPGAGCSCCEITRGLGWIIAGGESNAEDKTKSRPTHPDWALGVARQAWTRNVPFLWKQWGDNAPAYELDHNPQAQAMCVLGKVRKQDFGYGEGGRRLTFNVGKHAAGRTLEGLERNEMPPLRLIG